jgi:hypothetical protein
MSKVEGKCSACGVALELAVSEPFTGANLVIPLCPACTDRYFLTGGGMILELRQELEEGLFPLGKVTITDGAINSLAEAGDHAAAFLLRHARGDWGEFGHCDDIQLSTDERRRGWQVTDDSGKINKFNLINRRDCVMSAYATSTGSRLWVITRLDANGGTTILLPEEY